MLLVTLLACERGAAERPHDVVLVVVDTLRADVLGVYGADPSASPELDAWSRDALVFDRAYGHSSWTLPAFASLFTGLYPHEHRAVRSARDPNLFGHLGPEVVTLAESFAGGGWATAGFHHNSFLAPEFGLDQGFATYVAEDRLDADATVDDALAWLAKQDQSAFLFVHFMDPHMPYQPKQPYKGRFAPIAPGEPDQLKGEETREWKMGRVQPDDHTKARVRGLYREEVLATDAAIGRLLAGVAARNPLVVVTADHGEEHWDHGGFEHGHTLYSELTHIPLLARGPGVSPGRSDALVSHVDVYQALLHAAGIPAPAGTHGRDVLAIARGEAPPDTVVLEDGCLYGGQKVAVVDGTHRLVVDQVTGDQRTYAIGADGRETDRGQRNAEAGQALLAELLAVRGNLDTVESNGEYRASKRGVANQLQALGYLDK